MISKLSAFVLLACISQTVVQIPHEINLAHCTSLKKKRERIKWKIMDIHGTLQGLRTIEKHSFLHVHGYFGVYSWPPCKM